MFCCVGGATLNFEVCIRLRLIIVQCHCVGSLRLRIVWQFLVGEFIPVQTLASLFLLNELMYNLSVLT